MTTKDKSGFPEIDTGYTHFLKSKIKRYLADGAVGAIEDAMQFCVQHELNKNPIADDELKAVVAEVIKHFGHRHSRKEPRPAARRGPRSGATKHVERFVRVEKNIEAQKKTGKKPSYRQAMRDVASLEPMVTEDAIRKSYELEAAFGPRTTDFNRYKAAYQLDTTTYYLSLGGGGTTTQEIRQGVKAGVERATALLEQAVRSLKENLHDLGESASARTLQAYEGLDLQADIARAASKLYRDGHYANAIENAVKALNALVRLRSGRDDLDGTTLMETVFSPNRPILKFNDLADQSDRDEQKGFMMMFSGAVSGLRNPRAHKLIKDDPERALEFVAYISLLAKLLDGAK